MATPKTGEFIKIKTSIRKNIISDFLDEGLNHKAKLIQEIIDENIRLRVEKSDSKSVTVRYKGFELLLYDEEIMLQKKLMERF